MLGVGGPSLMAAHVRTVQVPEADRRKLGRRARDKGASAREVERAGPGGRASPGRAADRGGGAGQADRGDGRLPAAAATHWRRVVQDKLSRVRNDRLAYPAGSPLQVYPLSGGIEYGSVVPVKWMY